MTLVKVDHFATFELTVAARPFQVVKEEHNEPMAGELLPHCLIGVPRLHKGVTEDDWNHLLLTLGEVLSHICLTDGLGAHGLQVRLITNTVPVLRLVDPPLALRLGHKKALCVFDVAP